MPSNSPFPPVFHPVTPDATSQVKLFEGCIKRAKESRRRAWRTSVPITLVLVILWVAAVSDILTQAHLRLDIMVFGTLLTSFVAIASIWMTVSMCGLPHHFSSTLREYAFWLAEAHQNVDVWNRRAIRINALISRSESTDRNDQLTRLWNVHRAHANKCPRMASESETFDFFST